MSEQPQLFYEGPIDAIRALVQALGGAKKVGIALRPDKPIDDAARWVLDCMNPERREHFDLEQLLWLLKEGRRIGFHAPINWIVGEAGYGPPPPVDPDDELVALQRDFIASTKRQEQLVARIERLTQPQLQAVKR